MSSRQKSFFDQNHTNKQKSRPHWHRARSANAAPQKTGTAPREVMQQPPIEASTQSRTKLKAFQFIEGRPDDTADKENRHAPDAMRDEAEPLLEEDVSANAPPAKASVPSPVQSKTCPATPAAANRLPLADLIGNADTASKRAAAQMLSPDEQIYWHVKSPGSSQVVSTPARRKRARSSSPPEPQNEPSNFFRNRRERQASRGMKMKTPQADPAADLWNRYAVNTANMDTPTAAKTSTFAHLMGDSSPRASGTTGSVGGLRRWASCGVEWPTSRTKRRRTAGAFRETLEEDLDENEDDEAAELPQPKVSKLGFLVEKIQKNLAAPTKQRAPSGPSSSSPLPETGGYSSTLPASLDSSSEFGDADIDLDLLEVAEATKSTALNHLGSLPELPPPAAPVQDADRPEAPRARTVEIEPIKHSPVASDDDEFGLGDDSDDFGTDLELAVSQYDHRPSLFPPAPQPKVQSQRDDGERSVPKGDGTVHVIEDSDDEFGGDDINVDEFAEAEIAATLAHKASGVSSESDRCARTIQRYLVTNVVEGQYKTIKGYMQPEKVLVVEEERTKKVKAITLREAWYETRCTPGSYVHVIGQFSPTGQCTIDNASNMLILHPDHLISATTVADSFSCIRKAVLQDRIKATSDANEHAMIGTILHEIFQEALKANKWDHDWLMELIKRIIPRKFETILEIGLTVEHVTDRLVIKLPELQAWAKIFVKPQPGPDAIVKDKDGKTLRMSINKLLEVEEHIWSPMYGLKGNIDASVQVLMQDNCGERTLAAPFELKTGRSVHMAHRAQTALYTLLMSDRYDVDIAYGILFYLDSSEISRIPAVRNELCQMIIQRNDLACFVRERLQLPPMLTNSYACNKCYAQEACFLYHRLAEDGEAETLGSPAKQKFEELVRNLKGPHQDFFKKWDTLLTKEESEMKKFHRELWTMLSDEREKLGRCFANVAVEPGSFIEKPDGEKINRFQYTLVKHNALGGFSFTESQITIGEPIVVSDEKGHFALANGYVVSVRKRSITVAVDRRLHSARIRQPDFDPDTKQAFAGLMDVTTGRVASKRAGDDEEPILYRLDKDEFSNGMAMIRNNLIQLMNDSDFRSSSLRSLVVDGTAPTFKPNPSAYSIQTQSQSTAMNSDQEAAVEKVFSAQDYALVLGMPGTGKTTTIAHIIRSLVAKGKSVLLTSYTHTAVDNILLKIRNDGIGILRLGAAAKIHPEVQEFATIAAHPKSSLEELERSWRDPPVVATTCLTINHPIFRRRLFDYCIVDEASQITLPVCLGPIRMAKRFVLVGDHYQLPPLVQNKEAQEGGLDISLFRLLSEQHPEAVINLEHQYRMCADIMLLSNTLIYDGRLKCGSKTVADRSLSIPNIDALQRHHSLSQRSRSNPFGSSSLPSSSLCPGSTSPKCWLSHILEPVNKVIFLNTDLLLPASLETLSGSRILNPLEASLTVQIVESLLTTGISIPDIGVITFYRSQLALLRQSLRHRAGLELHTADKFQGRDKEIVVLSCVRSNEAQSVGELLRDWRRLNVAVTRARSKLVIVGSKKTLAGGNEVLKGLVELCDGRGWVVDLQPGAREAHFFEEGATQTQVDVEGAGAGVAGTSTSPVKKKNGGLRDLSPVEQPLGLKKVPEKKGMVGKQALLGKRPVLRDIVNDAL